MPDFNCLVVSLVSWIHFKDKRPLLAQTIVFDEALIGAVCPVIPGIKPILSLVRVKIISLTAVLHHGELVIWQRLDVPTLLPCGCGLHPKSGVHECALHLGISDAIIFIGIR